MPRIRTQELLNRISTGDFRALKLKGSHGGTFYLLLEGADGAFILENADGSLKEYPKADHALIWLKRMTPLKEIIVDLELWRNDL